MAIPGPFIVPPEVAVVEVPRALEALAVDVSAANETRIIRIEANVAKPRRDRQVEGRETPCLHFCLLDNVPDSRRMPPPSGARTGPGTILRFRQMFAFPVSPMAVDEGMSVTDCLPIVT